MRVALFLGKTLDEAFEFYDYLSKQLISLATPILFNAGTKNPNMISCNLTFLKGDDINGLFETYKDIGVASSDAAGIGLCIDNLRSSESTISSTNGKAHGWVGLAKIVNELMNVYNQGGKRPGSCALYGSVWHKDIFKFLELKLLTGEEKLRARDIFLAVNVPNNFMKAVKEDGDYYLFCPKDLKDNGIDLTGFGLGTVRTLREYELFTGIDFKQQRIQDYTLKVNEPPNSLPWDEGFITNKYDISINWDIKFFKNLQFKKPKFLTLGVLTKSDVELYRHDFQIETQPQYVNLENNQFTVNIQSIDKPSKIVIKCSPNLFESKRSFTNSCPFSPIDNLKF
jgi:ribonucleotide reductase alpha subunit